MLEYSIISVTSSAADDAYTSWNNNEGSANYTNDVVITYGVNIYNYNVGSEFKEKAFCFRKKENKLEQVKCPKIDIDLKEGEMLNLTYEKE